MFVWYFDLAAGKAAITELTGIQLSFPAFPNNWRKTHASSKDDESLHNLLAIRLQFYCQTLQTCRRLIPALRRPYRLQALLSAAGPIYDCRTDNTGNRFPQLQA